MNRTRVKVCCIASIEEAALAIAHGADAIGLVGAMPSGPGVISDELARTIAATVPPAVESFLLTACRTASEIIEHVQYCATTTVQIVQHIDPAEYPPIIQRLQNVRRVQVVHVEDRSALDFIDIYAPYVHAFLLDSGRPDAQVAEFGGTGRAHDWGISAEFVRRSPKPVFLAGGLNPLNARAAIDAVKPYGLDLCSGIRPQQRLDAQLLDEFTCQVWAEPGDVGPVRR